MLQRLIQTNKLPINELRSINKEHALLNHDFLLIHRSRCLSLPVDQRVDTMDDGLEVFLTLWMILQHSVY